MDGAPQAGGRFEGGPRLLLTAFWVYFVLPVTHSELQALELSRGTFLRTICG